jgi:hypothetical protein
MCLFALGLGVIVVNEGVELNCGLWLLTFLIIPFPFIGQLQYTSGPLSPSSHKRMRYMPFWCTCNHITQNWENGGIKDGKVVSMIENGMLLLSRNH